MENKNQRKTTELLSLSTDPSPIIVPIGSCKKCIEKKLSEERLKDTKIMDTEFLSDIEYQQRKEDGVQRSIYLCNCLCECDYGSECKCGQRSNKNLVYSVDDEKGITNHSLHNIKVFINRYGMPDEVILRYTDDNDHLVYVKWIDYSINGKNEPNCKFDVKLTGFGWNYGGYGNMGLNKFFEIIRADKVINNRLSEKNSLPDLIDDVLVIKRMGPEWKIIKKLTQKDLDNHVKHMKRLKISLITGAKIIRPICDDYEDI
jgi:hypothetical protein